MNSIVPIARLPARLTKSSRWWCAASLGIAAGSGIGGTIYLAIYIIHWFGRGVDILGIFWGLYASCVWSCFPGGVAALVVWLFTRRQSVLSLTLALWSAVLIPICIMSARDLQAGAPATNIVFYQAEYFRIWFPLLISGCVAIAVFEYLRRTHPVVGPRHQIWLHVPSTGESIANSRLLAELDDVLSLTNVGSTTSGGEDTIMMMGSNADTILSIIQPVLTKHKLPQGSFLQIKREGKDQERIELD